MTLTSFLQIAHLTFFQSRLCEELHNGHGPTFLLLFYNVFFKKNFLVKRKSSNDIKANVPFYSYPILLPFPEVNCLVSLLPATSVCIYEKNMCTGQLVYGFIFGVCIYKLDHSVYIALRLAFFT